VISEVSVCNVLNDIWKSFEAGGDDYIFSPEVGFREAGNVFNSQSCHAGHIRDMGQH
jgi:hypothetical protein